MQNKLKKQEKPIKDPNALKNMRDSFHTLTQNWLCILHDGCINRMFHIELNARHVFLLKLDNSGLNTKYGNNRFLAVFGVIFHFAEKRDGTLQNGLQIRTPRPRFLIKG